MKHLLPQVGTKNGENVIFIHKQKQCNFVITNMKRNRINLFLPENWSVVSPIKLGMGLSQIKRMLALVHIILWQNFNGSQLRWKMK